MNRKKRNNRAYWKKHPEAYEKHKAKMREYQRKRWKEGNAWNQKNKEKRRIYMREYWKRKKESG